MGLPPGKIDCVITYLEMTAQPTTPTPPVPAGKHALLRAEKPTVAYYRFLYEAVGTPWLWYERRLLDDDALAKIIEDPEIEIFVLYVAGVPAGYSELDRRQPPDIELSYFGLMPEFIGRGLGRYFLRWTVDQAWTHDPGRLWVHTCSLDHPRALGLYQRTGFKPFRQASTVIDDPRASGILPAAD
jgi:GNAT superfamily N-acetyltransferase